MNGRVGKALRAYLGRHFGESVPRAEHAEDLGPIQYRLDVLERGAELAPVLAQAYAVPSAKGRRLVVTNDWGEENRRRAICSAATGDYVELLRTTEKTLSDYARRQGWDLIVEHDRESSLPPSWLKFATVRDLLDEYELVTWLDADALLINPASELGAALDPAMDVHVTEPIETPGRPTVVDSGLIAFRSGPASRRLLDDLLANPDGDPDVALTEQLERSDPSLRVGWLDRRWNSIPSGPRAASPHMLHFAGAPLVHRRWGLIGAAADVLLGSASSEDPVEAVDRREDLPRLLNRLGLLGTGVEVGVRNGAFSAWILHRWQGYKLISVDPWTSASDEYIDIANVSQGRHEDLLAQTRHRLMPFGPRSEIWRKTSDEAAGLLPDSSLDFVYLDARHDEASVGEDLALWYPKLKRGGILAGHDYLDGDRPEGRFGVKTAVDRFFAAYDLPVNTTTEDAPWLSWFVLCPEI